MTSSHSLDRLQAKRARYLFWGGFILAAVTSMLLGLDPAAGLAPAVGASVVMFLYLLASKLWTPSILRHEDFADGFYYLGFLLTLVALVGTLVSLGEVSEQDVQRVVLARFGLALTTTIIGLAVRTALRMFQDAAGDSALDAIGSAQQALRRALEDLRLVLQNAATDMETTLGAATSKIDSTVGQLTGRLGTVNASVDEVGRRLAPLSEAFGAAEGKAQSLADSLGVAGISSKELVGQMDQLGTQLPSLGGPIERSVQGLKEFATASSEAAASVERLQVISASVSATSEALGLLANRLKELPDVSKGFQQMSDAIASGQEPIRDFVRSVGEVGTVLGKVRMKAESIDFEAMAELSSLVGRQTTAIDASLTSWERALTQLSQLTDRLGAREAEAVDSLLTVERELTAGVEYLTKVARRGDD